MHCDLFLLICLLTECTANYFYHKDSELEEIRVVKGYNATLPCRAHKLPRDPGVLVLWYIEEKYTPVYSLDRRTNRQGIHWSDHVLGSRAIFYPEWSPPSLLLTYVQLEDARLYKCRVDFESTNSQVSSVRLTVIEPPVEVNIEKTRRVVLGQKGDATCIATGGSPVPEVIWLNNGEVVDSTYNVSGTETINTLDLPANRDHHSKTFICQAINNDLQRPPDARYVRNITLAPLDAIISSDEDPLREGVPAHLTCTITGSHPPPKVTWRQGHNNYLQSEIAVLKNLTMSVSTVNITRKDHGRTLICKGENPLLPEKSVEISHKLNVYYAPVVTLLLGRGLASSNLRENTDVFFECLIDSNPPPYKIKWFHKEKQLTHNLSTGVLISGSTLALQSVRQSHSGSYKCEASNVEGDSTSNILNISIKYAPRCNNSPVLKGIALRESINISCNVQADPPDVKFHWTFNNSIRADQTGNVSPERYQSNGMQSTLVYTATSERDYGTLLCYAENSVGHQKVPCSFTLLSAGPPENLSNCSLTNTTSHSSNVICIPGFNGGLPQYFWLQVWSESGEQVVNFSSNSAEFLVRSLAPGSSYDISVTAFNSRGTSKPFTVNLLTLKEAEMHRSLPSRKAPTQLTMVLCVFGGSVLFVTSVTLLGWVVCCKRRCHNVESTSETLPDITPDLYTLKTTNVPKQEIFTVSNTALPQEPSITNSPCASFHETRPLGENKMEFWDKEIDVVSLMRSSTLTSSTPERTKGYTRRPPITTSQGYYSPLPHIAGNESVL